MQKTVDIMREIGVPENRIADNMRILQSMTFDTDLDRHKYASGQQYLAEKDFRIDAATDRAFYFDVPLALLSTSETDDIRIYKTGPCKYELAEHDPEIHAKLCFFAKDLLKSFSLPTQEENLCK